MLRWKYSAGWSLDDLSTAVSMSDNYALKEDEKRPFINVAASAASKTLTRGLGDGETALVTNVGGTNALTLKNVSGDTGTSLAAGKCAIVIGSGTADASTVLVLN